jgi:exodeoxyribonuclease V beta subunit
MNGRELFDISKTIIVPGTTLLEASAGTGKTFTIEGLYLRLSVEMGIPVERILVCTFTKAATRELSSRIRARLRNAREELENGKVLDPALSFRAPGSEALRRAAIALASFDTAQIFTIHGFCNRVLSEHAFESGSGFDTSLTGDGARLARQAARDFVRRMNHNTPLSMLCLSSSGQSLEDDCNEAYMLRGPDRDTPILPSMGKWDDADVIEGKFAELLDGIKGNWKRESAAITAFMNDPLLANAPLRNVADAVVRAMNDLAGGGTVTGETARAINALTSRFITDNFNKRAKSLAPDFAISKKCDAFAMELDVTRTTLVRRFMNEADAAIDEASAKAGVLSYDGLIYNTAKALRADGEGSLRSVLRKRYAAGMVDEFQDTDSLQWEIFSRIFSDGKHYFDMIGDPKQSIYRFRGADVNAYMSAAKSAGRVLTLGTNWRSDPPLVGAVNAIFGKTDKPFGNGGIEFLPVEPSNRSDPARAFFPGPKIAKEPMRFVIPSGDSPTGNATMREDYLMRNLSADICALLSGSTIGTRSVEGSDIAVIVRTHRQAALVRGALTNAGIQSVEESDESVFDSDEAAAFSDLFSAALRPDDPRLAKWVLAGSFFDMSAAELIRLREDDVEWSDILEAFRAFSASWEAHGVLRAFRELESRANLRAKVMARHGGERILTNILHVAELLGEAEKAWHLDRAALSQWLCRMRLDPDSRPQEGGQIRLESDEKAVKIVTAHKSKGLEFPIVFLPFVLDRRKSEKKRYILSHEDGRSVLWIAPEGEVPKETLEDALRELREEEIRLLYVELTRAKSRCVAYLLPDGFDKDADGVALASVLGVSDWKSLVASLEKCAQEIPGAIAVERREASPGFPAKPAEDAPPELCCRNFHGVIDTRGMLTSFSALHEGLGETAGEAEIEAPEHGDFPAGAPEESTELSGMAAFPRGTEAGKFLHLCLEKLDYSDETKWLEVVRKNMDAYGFDKAAWLETVVQNLSDVLHAPLSPSGPALFGKKPEELSRECEFYIPAHGVNVAKLAGAFREAGGAFARQAGEIARIGTHDVDGYLKGFVDLIFRDGGKLSIIDWKSNWMGQTADFYTPERLDGEMIRSAYYLQGCLYTLALCRNMSARKADWDYESGFGSVYYVFLRGANRGTACAGVVRFRPDARLLLNMADALGCGKGASS